MSVQPIDQVKDGVNKQFAAANPQWDVLHGMDCLTIDAAANFDCIQYLYQQAGFQFLTDLTAVHYPDRTNQELCVVAHLHNLMDNIRIRIKSYLPIASPNIQSLVPLFPGANWMERETYDFYGVTFTGHPDLRRILNADEMDYFPMRKEYPMEDPTRMDKDDEMFGRG
jgi:NADH-quinone oxidoreductase subunit C